MRWPKNALGDGRRRRLHAATGHCDEPKAKGKGSRAAAVSKDLIHERRGASENLSTAFSIALWLRLLVKRLAPIIGRRAASIVGRARGHVVTPQG